MIIEVKSLLLILGVLAGCLVIKLLWELVLLLKRTRQSLEVLDKTMMTYQELADKTSSTLGEVDTLLGDAQEITGDYRLVKNEVFTLGSKAGEVASQIFSQLLK